MIQPNDLWTMLDAALPLLRENPLCGQEARQLENLRKRLAENQLVLAVFGQFKRGKSTFINQLLGAPVLPTGIVPVTSVVTQLFYKEQAGAEVSYEKAASEKIPLKAVKAFVDEGENPENYRQVTGVAIGYPADFLKSGVVLVDTPGVGSLHRGNTDMASGFTGKTDAAIFMLSVDSPINEIECRFIKQLQKDQVRLYFAVNKTDTVSGEDLRRYLDYCQAQLEKLMGGQESAIYPISAATPEDEGIQRLMNRIFEDFERMGTHLLADSVARKAARALITAEHKLALSQSAYEMPLEQLQAISENLQSTKQKARRMADEAVYLMQMASDQLISDLEAQLNRRRPEALRTLGAVLDDLNGRSGDLPPKAFDKALRSAVEREVSAAVACAGEENLARMRAGYEAAANSFSQALQEITRTLYREISACFQAAEIFTAEAHTLSAASDLRFEVFPYQAELALSPDRLVFLLPPKRARARLLKQAQTAAEESLKRGFTSLLSDNRYRLRESQRQFGKQFQEEVGAVEDALDAFMAKTLVQRAEVKASTDDTVSVLERQRAVLMDYSRQIETALDKKAAAGAERRKPIQEKSSGI